MRAALQLGRWTFPAPLGYLNAPKWSGKSLVPDPERASLVKQMFEDYAGGRFTNRKFWLGSPNADYALAAGSLFRLKASGKCCAALSTSGG
jgi:hypothetical protein